MISKKQRHVMRDHLRHAAQLQRKSWEEAFAIESFITNDSINTDALLEQVEILAAEEGKFDEVVEDVIDHLTTCNSPRSRHKQKAK